MGSLKALTRRTAWRIPGEHPSHQLESDVNVLGRGPEAWLRLTNKTSSGRALVPHPSKEGSEWTAGIDLSQILSAASQRSETFLEGIIKKLAAEYSPYAPGKQENAGSWDEAFALRGIVNSLKRLESRVASMESMLESLRSSKGSLIVSVNTFSPAPYDMVRAIQVAVYPLEGGFCASFYDANLHSTGDTEEESISNLKGLLIDTFESLLAEEPNNLGPEPLRQLTILREFLVARL